MHRTAFACLNLSLPHVIMWMARVTVSLDTLDQHAIKVCMAPNKLIRTILKADYVAFIECLDGFYGQGCLDVCHCDNGECNFITGFCSCLIGYVGVACNMGMLTSLSQLEFLDLPNRVQVHLAIGFYDLFYFLYSLSSSALWSGVH